LLKQQEVIPVVVQGSEQTLKFHGKEIIRNAIFFDLEHYLYKEPIAIGVFGAAVYDEAEKAVITTQYMIENKRDARAILELTKEYFINQKNNGKQYLVTFSGNNDFLVINHLYQKYDISYSFEEEFELIDLQKEYEHKFQKNIGLKNLEKLHQIDRGGELISGMTLAKTFSKIIKDQGYFDRMPLQKVEKILKYNEEDVVNLFNIMNHWEEVTLEDVLILEERIQKDKLEKLALKELLEKEKEEAENHGNYPFEDLKEELGYTT
jgi:uncharacterized protein YprB with RNaseH-like and TPR domain